jgi:hypothetical protein
MVTNTVSDVSHSESVKEPRRVIGATTELKKQDNTRFSMRQLLKGFGICSMLLLGAAALAPNVFGIPLGLRPWVFVVFIFWFFAFCAGMFHS